MINCYTTLSALIITGIILVALSCKQLPRSTQGDHLPSDISQPLVAELTYEYQAMLGEGALWNHQTQTLWWIDIEGKTFNIFDPKTAVNTQYQTPSRIGTVVPSDDGSAIIAAEEGIMELNLTSRQTSLITPVESDIADTRLNDGKCDPAGRLFVGSMDRKTSRPLGSLYQITKSQVTHLLDSITISNGIVWKSDHTTMYYIDTPTGKIMAYNYDINTGQISDPKVAVTIPKTLGYPDGMAIDQDDNLWVGMWNGNAVINFDPITGDIIRKIQVPAHNVTSCAFGGPDLDTLYITTARVDMTDDELAEKPLSGSIFHCVPGVKGVQSNSYIK